MRKTFRRGFTLSEAMVAMFVVAFAILGFGTLFPSASRSMVRSRSRDLAAQAAQGELEYWRSVGYRSIHTILLPDVNSKTLPMTTSLPAGLSDSSGQTMVARANPDFTDQTGEPEDSGRVRITVSISWQEPNGQPGSFQVTTIVADNGVEEAVDQDDPDDADEEDVEDPDTDDDKEVSDIDPEEDDEELDLTFPTLSLPTR